MHRSLIAVLILLCARSAVLGKEEVREGREKEVGTGRDEFVHPFLLAMQKCLSADSSVEQCGGVEEANEVRVIVGHFDNGMTNISGDEAYMRFDAVNFSAMVAATVHHVQLFVYKRSFSSDAIAGVVRSGCAKNGVILQVDLKNSPMSQVPNQTLPVSDLARESWIRFELGGPQKWLRSSGNSFQFKITANCNAPMSQILSAESGGDEYEPYLVLYSKSTRSTRVQQGGVPRRVARQRTHRRGAGVGTQFATSSACGLRKYEVNVSAIFGAAAIYPAKYEANYCDGICGDPENTTAPYHTSHARLQYYLSVVLRQPSPPVPRCVPGSYSTVVMLFSEYGKIVLQAFQDLSASSCQCL